ncbi:hypothetical protein [Erythrobacter ani]|uniref:Uncharacterized protein n=1 Tax=Erythrobacter ani TaxID=2827235 RepID=A0ABS6SID2_9SPHN|nr:hypothetical protein [Erythrobacter ani]MBV7264770.1 hypothetical protein [Erythrobacter ani]
MSLFDQILGAAHNHPTVKNMADKLGIDQSVAEKAIAALTDGHQADGDTLEVASAKSGLDQNILSQVMAHVGGEGSLTGFMQLLDQDHDGNPLNDITDMASGLFGKK